METFIHIRAFVVLKTTQIPFNIYSSSLMTLGALKINSDCHYQTCEVYFCIARVCSLFRLSVIGLAGWM